MPEMELEAFSFGYETIMLGGAGLNDEETSSIQWPWFWLGHQVASEGRYSYTA